VAHDDPLPHALAHEGALDPADCAGVSGSMQSGPGVRITLRVDAAGRVVAAGFETCRLDDARAAASALCGRLCGLELAEASAITVVELAELAGLSPTDPAVRTTHYAKSAALLRLIGRRAHGVPPLVCTCFHVDAPGLRRVIAERGLRTVEDVRRHVPVTTGCGCCRPDVERLLGEAATSAGPPDRSAPGPTAPA
jgi:bacterioferritin-associated ferredoxin/NifU-like protein involved in Fe-S cluster formation